MEALNPSTQSIQHLRYGITKSAKLVFDVDHPVGLVLPAWTRRLPKTPGESGQKRLLSPSEARFWPEPRERGSSPEEDRSNRGRKLIMSERDAFDRIMALSYGAVSDDVYRLPTPTLIDDAFEPGAYPSETSDGDPETCGRRGAGRCAAGEGPEQKT